jgi:hypothetical protein
MHNILLEICGAQRLDLLSGVHPFGHGPLALAALVLTPHKRLLLEIVGGLMVLLLALQQLAKVSKPIAFVWDRWNRLMHGVGNFQARLILTLMYYVVVMPFGLIVRSFTDPLRIKHPPTAWLAHSDEKMDMDWAKRL